MHVVGGLVGMSLVPERYCVGGAGDLSNPKTWVAGQPQIDWRTLTSDVEAATHVANLEQAEAKSKKVSLLKSPVATLLRATAASTFSTLVASVETIIGGPNNAPVKAGSCCGFSVRRCSMC